MKRRKKIIRIGLDFDGVVVYNPLRLARAPITLFKREVLGIRRLSFFVPQKKWQQELWKLLHKSSSLPANGLDLFRQLVDEGAIEPHLITARFSFLDGHLYKWLEKHKLSKLFKTINMNLDNKQPHLFKEEMIKRYKLDYFIEDNLNIVEYLDGKVKTQVLWINNIIDRVFIKRRTGFPYLGKALEKMLERA